MPAVVNSPVSTAGKLNSFEKALIRAVEAGRNYWPSPKDLRPGKVIRGELIRAMLLGSPPSDHPGAGWLARRVRLTSHGIRIAPPAPRAQVAAGTTPAPLLHVVGQLDLRGVAASDGGFLPPLEFSQCLFERPIELDGAHLRSLALRACRFSRLSAKVARFSGNVVFSECGPRSDPRHAGERNFACHDLAVMEADPARPDHDSYAWMRPAWRKPPERSQPCPCPLCASPATGEADNCNLCCILDLNSAHIEGGLEISRSYWRAPNVIGRHYGAPPVRDEVAIELRGVQVRDTIKIVHSTTIGRVSVVSAEVEDDFWVWGGKFFASADRPTFDFQLATIGGLLAFRAQRADAEDKPLAIRAYPVVVIGHISAIGLRAGEVWISEGFYFGHDKDKRGSFPTLNFAKSDIRGTFKVGAYHDYQVLDPARPTAAANVHGDICVVAANIGKNFELLGLRHEGIQEVLGTQDRFFDCLGIDRDEAPYLKLTAQGLKVDRRGYIAHARFRDADVPHEASSPVRPKNSAPAAVDLWKSTIGTGFRIDHHSSCIGALRLNSCVIGREVVVGCRKIEPSDADFAAADLNPGDIPLLVDISESTINGRLRIGRHEPRSKRDEDAIEVAGGISLQSTNVQGGILLGHLTFDLRDYPEPLPSSEERVSASARVALDLRDLSCGSDLEIHSLHWRVPRLALDRRRAIAAPPTGIGAFLGTRHRPRFVQAEPPSFAEIDMRGLQCGMLIDGFGDEWGLVHRLRIRLAGMQIADVEPASHDPPHARAKTDDSPVAARGRQPHLARLRWLAFQNRVQEVLDESESPKQRPPNPAVDQRPAKGWKLLAGWARVWDRFWRRHYCSRDDDFVPQAYEVFSSAYRRGGEDATAEAILVEKKNIQNALRFQRLRELWRANVWGTRPRTGAAGSLRQPPPVGRANFVPTLKRSWKTLWLWLVAVGFGLWVLSRELKIHAPSSAMVISGIILLILLWPYVMATSQLIFRSGFRYGLSPNSALIVFFICLAVGWGGVHLARNGGFAVRGFSDLAKVEVLDPSVALVLDVDYEPVPDPPPPDPSGKPLRPNPPCEGPPAADPVGAGQPAPEPKPTARPMRNTGHALRARPSPCNLDVNSLLYAIDIFLPLIDLDQERRCTIREVAPGPNGEKPHDDYAHWRLLKALYEVLGWIITSLVILTITGVLRRDLER